MIAKLKAVLIKGAINLNHSSFLRMKTAEKLNCHTTVCTIPSQTGTMLFLQVPFKDAAT